MLTPWNIYWITRLDSIGVFLGINYFCIIAALIVVSIILLIRTVVGDYDKPDILWKPFRRLFIAFLINSLGWFIPTTKEMVAIIVVPKIVNNKKMSQLPEKLAALADNWIEELRPNKK